MLGPIKLSLPKKKNKIACNKRMFSYVTSKGLNKTVHLVSLRTFAAGMDK